MKKLNVINLVGGPGAGKSTTASALFALMKRDGYRVELVTEYAKAVTYEKRFNLFSQQDYIFAKQYRQLARLREEADWAITDSPLILTAHYTAPDAVGREHLINYMKAINDTFSNYYFLLDRVKPYMALGRTQTEEEARAIDPKLENILNEEKISYIRLPGDDKAEGRILQHIRTIK